MSRTCANPRCGAPLGGTRRAQTTTCSNRCRMALSRARRASTVPAELRERDRWVLHDAAKAPRTPGGAPASVTDPATWSRFSTVRSRPRRGFVLDGDGIVCIDLDDCLDAGGALSPLATALLRRCPPTYVEVSPSGRGLHVWGRGEVARGRRLRRGGGKAEIYGAGRYITVTGRPHGGAPSVLGDLSGVIRWLLT
ncbi:bifunctional DNA primase/polymerase [Allonocardiopsis opalescens]|uniref:Bifunctional DNA primase/polymerase-like protein n=1 Tax=Allonocardiopsis opalescens TaxID=1144618 RepID=A0A2T0PVL9_9ACTN|nr:bifunctional DNA primase/polymerase [Allonocardiopsis opalescens]PRX95585.1 bifunctional DNA primase/polymerase-like protein [Allonocardiopsis opalescens]